MKQVVNIKIRCYVTDFKILHGPRLASSESSKNLLRGWDFRITRGQCCHLQNLLELSSKGSALMVSSKLLLQRSDQNCVQESNDGLQGSSVYVKWLSKLQDKTLFLIAESRCLTAVLVSTNKRTK